MTPKGNHRNLYNTPQKKKNKNKKKKKQKKKKKKKPKKKKKKKNNTCSESTIKTIASLLLNLTSHPINFKALEFLR